MWNYVQKVLEKVFHDVRDNRRFDSLQKEIHEIAKKQESEHNLSVDAEIWQDQAEQLRELLEIDRKANEENRKKTISLDQKSDAQLLCEKLHGPFRCRTLDILNPVVAVLRPGYAEKWAKARLEQQDLKLKLQKTDMMDELSDNTREYSTEQIISAEMTAFLETDITDKKEQTAEWTKRYNEEIVQRQQEIDELKRKIEKQKFETEEMRALRDTRQEFIDECDAEEKRLQEEARYREKLNRAATIIQSAWRDYMVRHKLGQYKDLGEQTRSLEKSKKPRGAAGKKRR
ncbi:PREDICTED: IQ domain-containing protein D-like [Dinoponera quadriceps]|uniref:IQ domain-containing protein D-like n=1 Tax=Dinoponera quadriceps TaxID=609295 RepID=A0A6P3XV19_DINQU|nr:PREDICTED: IQ domain-containing protein D-like [Dinoponera quadriceps]